VNFGMKVGHMPANSVLNSVSKSTVTNLAWGSVNYILFKGLVLTRAGVIQCCQLHVYFLFVVSACGFGSSILEKS
jgi:hypothetical protein